MKEAEKLNKLGRLVAEWNHTGVHDPEATNKAANEVCHEFVRLHNRVFIREWNKLLKETKVMKK